MITAVKFKRTNLVRFVIVPIPEIRRTHLAVGTLRAVFTHRPLREIWTEKVYRIAFRLGLTVCQRKGHDWKQIYFDGRDLDHKCGRCGEPET